MTPSATSSRPEVGIRCGLNWGSRSRVVRYTAAKFASTVSRIYDLAQQIDDEDAAWRRTALDLQCADCSHHLVIATPGPRSPT